MEGAYHFDSSEWTSTTPEERRARASETEVNQPLGSGRHEPEARQFRASRSEAPLLGLRSPYLFIGDLYPLSLHPLTSPAKKLFSRKTHLQGIAKAKPLEINKEKRAASFDQGSAVSLEF